MSHHATPEELAAAARRELAAIQDRKQALTPKDRRAIPLQEMPSQPASVRRGNMQEVALGYTAEQAQLESLRCLQCRTAPCVDGCPVRIDIPGFLKAAGAGDFEGALAIITRNSLLPAVCGRVCPQETQCQEHCTMGKVLKDPSRAVSIGRVERYVADRGRQQGTGPQPTAKAPTGRKVAVIGTGPASITVAADVRREGHDVVMFEAFHKPGGVLLYGIPEFRLPKAIVKAEIDALVAMGVEIRTNFLVGRTRKLRDLMEKDGFEAVFIGTGAGLPKFMNIEGENLVGVFAANEYLTRANLMRAYDKGNADTPIYASRRVAVLGGGNVAMDAARTALRLGAEAVHLIYRRSRAEMPARLEEVTHAEEEGVTFHMLANAKRVLGDEYGCVKALECVRYELGEPDASGRRRPVEIPGSAFIMDVDTVIVAVGNGCNPLIRQTTDGLLVKPGGTVIVNDAGETSLKRVFAGGDIVLGAATVILAMGEGRRAAVGINALLAGVPDAVKA
jgi:glutamate synthase (NADPH/NADH) small chain